MVFNITIVEDEAAHAGKLRGLLAEWGEENGADISVRCFQEGGSLFADGYDDDELFFLDISLASSNGIDIARKLRSEGFRGNIIFLTSFSEYVFDGYHVQALDYLLKPIDRERLDRCMKPILRDMAGSCYTVRTKSELIKIPYHKIMAFTSFRHYVDIQTQIPVSPTDKSTFRSYRHKTTLKALQQQLPQEFVKCHRTVIVNMNKVMKVTCTDLTLSDNTVYPISESCLEDVRKAFAELLH